MVSYIYCHSCYIHNANDLSGLYLIPRSNALTEDIYTGNL